jgi:hypothetical protein
MATLQQNKIGILNINLIQGNNKPITLVFKKKDVLGELVPIDLTEYSEIKMDVKTSVNVNETSFLTFDLDEGFTISGNDNEILSFEFTDEFLASQKTEWFYDMKFVKDEKVMQLIKGVIRIEKIVTR